MNTLIKFCDAPCHPVSARRSTWPRRFRNASSEQIAEIGRAFARGDKRTVDQAYEELKATSLRRLRKTVSRNSPLNSWKETKTLMSQQIDSASIADGNGGDGTDIGAYEVQMATPTYAGQVQPPINADGTSVFNSRRGVVPVKFNLTQGGIATCDLPPATIAVTRTGGGVTGQVNESVYSGNADTGSNFRIDQCQYVYNLYSRALGVGLYRVDILINGQVVGSARFELR